jgi:tripartite-type tricarboxylate transporter receptor subunit TctC
VIATFPSSFSKLAFDPIKDLVPVGGIGITPTLLVAAKSVPADDLKGLVQLSKQRPDGLSFSTAGYGLLQHLAVEEMSRRADAKFVHVV